MNLVNFIGYDEERFKKLADVNRGAQGANMTTLGLNLYVTNKEAYRLAKSGLEISKEIYPTDLEKKANQPNQVIAPSFLSIDAIWDKTPYVSGDQNNILGDNGRLTLESNKIQVPVSDAIDPYLAYFGAVLIRPNESVRFPDEIYPIWKMEVGDRYVSDTLMTRKGGGFYLEFHDDQPHFHMPLKGGGVYLLAKWNLEKTKLEIAGFKIPDGYAVYTKKGAIHCDAALTGALLVGYTTSENCSTVLLRDSEDQLVEIEFMASF